MAIVEAVTAFHIIFLVDRSQTENISCVLRTQSNEQVNKKYYSHTD